MNHLVVTVHGIRTFGQWQDRLERLLSPSPPETSRTVIAYRYGYFSVLAFLAPPLRWLVVRRFRSFFLDQCEGGNWERIDLVGHSFGTHIIGWALHGIPVARRPKIHTIILAGSVLKNTFPWQTLIGKGVGRLVNDCGTKDGILILTQFLVLFTGMAGRLGFNGGTGRNFRNRFFAYGHSDYFIENGQPFDRFMENYWVPLLTSDGETEMVDVRESKMLTGIEATLLNNAEPIKLAAYLTPLLLITLWIYGQWQRAEATLAASTKSANELVLDIAQNFRATAGVPQEMIVRLLNQSLKLVDGLAAAGNLDDELERSRGYALASLSLAFRSEKKPEESLKAATAAVDIFRTLTKKAPDKASNLTGLAVSLIRRGDAYSSDGRQEIALDDYRESLSLSEAHASVESLRNTALGHERMGSLLLHQKRFSEALVELEEGVKIWKRLTPDIQQANGLSTGIGLIATALEGLGRDQDSMENYRESIRMTEALAAATPRDTDVKRGLSVTYQQFGNFLIRQGMTTEALALLDKDLLIARELSQSDEDRIDWQRDLFRSLGQYGDVLAKSEQLGDAIKTYQESVAYGERLLSKYPDATLMRDLAIDYLKMGDALKAANLHADAVQAYRRSLDIRRALDKAATGPSEDDKELANAYQRLANAYIADHQAERAVETARERVAQTRKWTKTEATSELQASALGNLAWYALFAGLPQEALAASDEGMSLSPKLVSLRLNRAHALMFAGQADEARNAYLEDQPGAVQEKWAGLIEDDFSALKKAGLSNPLMAEIEATLKRR